MPLEQGQVEEAAAFLFHLRVQRETATGLPFEIAPRSLDDAYAIQDAIHDTAGWPIGVLKVGCTSEIAQQMLSIPHPIGGRIPAEAVFESGADLPRSMFGNPPAIECEVAMRLDAAGQVDALAPAIELVDPRVVSQGNFGGMTTVADNSAGCAVVLGAASGLDVDAVSDLGVTLADGGGTQIAHGATAAVLGGPQASVDWAVTHEAARGRSVAAGMWIITGTCTGLTPTEWGGSYTADFGPLGTVGFSLTS